MVVDLRKRNIKLVSSPVTFIDKLPKEKIVDLRKPKTKKKKSTAKDKAEKFLIGQASLISGTIAGIGAFAINPALSIPAFLATTAGTASLLGAIREKPSFFGNILGGGAGKTIVTLPETIGQTVKDIDLPKVPSTGLSAKEIAALIAAAGVGAGAGVGITKIIEVFRDRPGTNVTANIPKATTPSFPTFTAPPTFQAQPIGTQQQAQPIGIVEKQVEEKVKEKPVPVITNKINVSPEINIRFSKSKKFINQQILV